MKNIFYNAVYGGICSLTVLVVGLLLPRSWFNPENCFFAERSWENGGRIYNRFHISKWKNRLPDMSKYIKGMIAKRIYGTETAEDLNRLIAETCVAEAAHWALIVLSLGMAVIWQSVYGLLCCVLYAAGNVPYVMIQRYNRPRLMRMKERIEKRN